MDTQIAFVQSNSTYKRYRLTNSALRKEKYSKLDWPFSNIYRVLAAFTRFYFHPG